MRSWRPSVPPREPPRLTLAQPAPELVIGLPDDSIRVARYFEDFDWEGTAPDPGVLSAEDFLAGFG